MGARIRTERRRDETARPTPTPVQAVKSGWAKGLARQRSTNVADRASTPPGPRLSVPL